MASFLKKATEQAAAAEKSSETKAAAAAAAAASKDNEVKKGRYFDLPLTTHRLLDKMKYQLRKPMSEMVDEAIRQYAKRNGVSLGDEE